MSDIGAIEAAWSCWLRREESTSEDVPVEGSAGTEAVRVAVEVLAVVVVVVAMFLG
jgi:hypothetical protein